MGYEVKIFAGELLSLSETTPQFFSDNSMVDICKPGHDSEILKLMQKKTGPLVYLYALDGNTQFTEDRYGAALHAYNIDEALEAIEKDAETDKYRRYALARDWLRAVKKHMASDRLAVVFFGY